MGGYLVVTEHSIGRIRQRLGRDIDIQDFTKRLSKSITKNKEYDIVNKYKGVMFRAIIRHHILVTIHKINKQNYDKWQKKKEGLAFKRAMNYWVRYQKKNGKRKAEKQLINNRG